MPDILLHIGPRMARALERVAPAKTRSRSRFIRLAIERALMELDEPFTREAYLKQPQEPDGWFDPSTWSEWDPKPPAKRRRSPVAARKVARKKPRRRK